MVLDELGRLVADVQVHAVHTQALHLVVDGAGDDVARGQLGARVEALHEALAVGQLEQAAFAAHRLGDQEVLRLRVVQAGRVELVELQVADPAAGAPGHGDAVARRDIRVGGILINLGRSAGG
ncbi:hypothetical protein D3C71_1906590 [compost metagenome]